MLSIAIFLPTDASPLSFLRICTFDFISKKRQYWERTTKISLTNLSKSTTSTSDHSAKIWWYRCGFTSFKRYTHSVRGGLHTTDFKLNCEHFVILCYHVSIKHRKGTCLINSAQKEAALQCFIVLDLELNPLPHNLNADCRRSHSFSKGVASQSCWRLLSLMNVVHIETCVCLLFHLHKTNLHWLCIQNAIALIQAPGVKSIFACRNIYILV